MYPLLDIVRATARFVVVPLTQPVNTIGKTAMWLVVNTTRIEATEVGAGLNQRRYTTGHAIAFRVSLAQLGRQQIRELDLADLAFNLVIGHFRFEIVFETVLTEQLDEELLR